MDSVLKFLSFFPRRKKGGNKKKIRKDKKGVKTKKRRNLNCSALLRKKLG